MVALSKSTNIINNALYVFVNPEYVGLATEIKCIDSLEAEIYGKTYSYGRHFENPKWPPS
jgi:hypothetical protein